MHKRPLFVGAIFFIVGIVLGRYLLDGVKFAHILIVTAIFIISSFLVGADLRVRPKNTDGSNGPTHRSAPTVRQKIANILLLLSVIFFATLLYINSNIFPNNHISHFLGEERLKTDIVGIIRSPALTRKPYYGKINSTYLFEVESIEDGGEWFNVKGLSQIRIQTEKDYGYGDRLLVNGTIGKPFLPKEKKDFNYREYLERQNIFALINTKENNVTVLSRDYKSNPILRYTYLIRERLKNQFIERMPLETGAFLRAILLGDRSELPKHIQENFKNSGTMHVLPTQYTKKPYYRVSWYVTL